MTCDPHVDRPRLSQTYQYDSDNYDTGIQRSRVYEDYIEYLRVNEPDQQPLNAAGFGKLVKTVFPGIRTRRLGIRGQSRYDYCGIAYKQPQPLSSQQQQRRRSTSPSPSTAMMNDGDTDMPTTQQQGVIVKYVWVQAVNHIINATLVIQMYRLSMLGYLSMVIVNKYHRHSSNPNQKFRNERSRHYSYSWHHTPPILLGNQNLNNSHHCTIIIVKRYSSSCYSTKM